MISNDEIVNNMTAEEKFNVICKIKKININEITESIICKIKVQLQTVLLLKSFIFLFYLHKTL